MKKILYSFIISSFFFIGCDVDYIVAEQSIGQVSIDQEQNEDSLANALISPYKEELSATINEVICKSAMEMSKNRPEGLLGNFVADLILDIGQEMYIPDSLDKIDFCYLNHGGLRASLPQGDISRQRVFELMPFENELVVITLSKQGILDLVEYVKQRGGDPVAGIRLKFSGDISDVMINGKTLDPNKNYKVITTDYLANGGDRMHFFTADSRLNIEKVGIKMRDAIMYYFEREGQEGRLLKSNLDGRIQFL